jgi:hypothetical protein
LIARADPICVARKNPIKVPTPKIVFTIMGSLFLLKRLAFFFFRSKDVLRPWSRCRAALDLIPRSFLPDPFLTPDAVQLMRRCSFGTHDLPFFPVKMKCRPRFWVESIKPKATC